MDLNLFVSSNGYNFFFFFFEDKKQKSNIERHPIVWIQCENSLLVSCCAISIVMLDQVQMGIESQNCLSFLQPFPQTGSTEAMVCYIMEVTQGPLLYLQRQRWQGNRGAVSSPLTFLSSQIKISLKSPELWDSACLVGCLPGAGPNEH